MILLLKRLLVLVLGIFLAWLTVFTVFPLLDNWMPLAIAILITYCLVAYFGLPALHRFSQILYKPTHVPTRTHSSDGWALDPVNLVVLAQNENAFVSAMTKAGWAQADPLNLQSSLKMIRAVVFKKSYPTAPFSNTYAFGRKQNLCFQIEIDGNPSKRHHVRFWRLGTTILEDEHEHHGFWHSLISRFNGNKQQIWIGAASLETGVNINRYNLQIVHKQEGNTDVERDFLVGTLKDAKVLEDSIGIKASKPLHTRYQGFREKIIADGYVTLCQIKSTKKRP
ncbi:MAG TPA: LssY C-terminal domain-containing protein [Candidatus Saccharimonadales bacterium]|nr:LssY C-terminal domain-containing protein [Candidatus Saccharimonadales bacterium]